MGITDGITTAYNHLIGRKPIKTIKRKQFNLTMDEEIILKVKLIAAILDVPYYIACEHILQVGSHHLLQDFNDPEKREELEEHLVKVHLLGDKSKDY